MPRDPETSERLRSIKEMAAMAPGIIIAGASVQDPNAGALADKLGRQLYDYIGTHKKATAATILAASAIGYAIGLVIDTEQPGAGEALDMTIDALARVVRFSAERGFAESRENRNG